MSCHPATMSWEAAPVCWTVICYCLLNRFALLSCERRPRGSLPAFAWSDLACLLNPYPLHCRGAFAFSTFLYPHLHRLPLWVAFPMPGEIWVCHVSFLCQSGLGPSLSAGSLDIHDRRTRPSCTGSVPFGQACQHLWLVGRHDVYQDFAYAVHTTQS